MKRKNGFVRWFDLMGDDGILTDFDGNEWYFNSWSFEKTRYRVTGICKKTKKKKTIETKHYPGLFLSYTILKDPITSKITYTTPVSFEAVEGLSDYRWAVKIVPDFSKAAQRYVCEYRLELLLDSVLNSEFDFKTNWHEYYLKRLDELLEKMGSL